MKFLIIASLLSAAVSEHSSMKQFKLNEIKFSDLASLDETTALKAANILSTVGILKITGLNNLNKAQDTAFGSLSACLLSNQKDPTNNIYETTMTDGTKRLTIGSKSNRGHYVGDMNPQCGQPSLAMRSLVDLSSRQLFLALDLANSLSSGFSNSNSEKFLMKPYQSFRNLMDNGEHLEHLHVFYNTKASVSKESLSTSQLLANQNNKFQKFESSKSTLEMHTDDGIMIAMTTGYYTTSKSASDSNNSQSNNSQRGLYVTMPSGEVVHVDENDLTANDVIIMMGQGATDWLSPSANNIAFRAVPHALVVDLGDDKDATRNWYGKMFLPPSDAELYKPAQTTFQEYRAKQMTMAKPVLNSVQRSSSSRGSLTNVPAACEQSSTTGNIGHFGKDTRMLVASTCTASNGDSGIMCWMGCLSTASLTCSVNQQASCVSTTTGLEVGPMVMPAKVACLSKPVVNNNNTKNNNQAASTSGSSFCYGTGVSMSMTGFEQAGTDTECFVYLFPSWVLDTSVKYGFACFGTVLMGIFIHILSKLRHTNSRASYSKTVKFGLNIVIYFVQILLSYAIMLIAMTYSVELFLMVCVGLTVGFGLFSPQAGLMDCMSQTTTDNKYETMFSINSLVSVSGSGSNSGGDSEGGSGVVEPCCECLDYSDNISTQPPSAPITATANAAGMTTVTKQ